MTTATRRRRADLVVAVAANVLVVLAFAVTLLGGRSGPSATGDPAPTGPPSSLEVLASMHGG